MAKKSASCPTPATRRKILVVDDHPVYRAGLISLIGQEPDLTVSGEANDAAQTLASLDRLQPDIILMDMSLPGRGGLELLKDVRTMYSTIPILIVSMHDETLYAERVVRAGARGYIMKQADPDKIIEAIRKVLSGGVYLSQRMASNILDGLSGFRGSASTPAVSKLTDREFEVLRMIGTGIDAHDIASQLHLSIKTVDTHRAHIREKLGVKNTTELIHFATRWVREQP